MSETKGCPACGSFNHYVRDTRTPSSEACSRCRKPIEGFAPPQDGMTAGYYLAAAWPDFAKVGEHYICDHCMWSDPHYIEWYGRNSPATPSEKRDHG